MVMKQTSFNPSPHRHLLEDVIGANQAFYGDEGRTEPPICEMQYAGTFSAANATDVAMGAGWVAVQDNATMFFAAEAGGIGSGYARIRIPQDGRYDIEWQYYIDGIGTTTCSASVLKDSATVTSGSLINAQGAGNGWAAPMAKGTKFLTAGTFLYFWLWHNAGSAKTVHGAWFGGSRSHASVRWVSAV